MYQILFLKSYWCFLWDDIGFWCDLGRLDFFTTGNMDVYLFTSSDMSVSKILQFSSYKFYKF